MTLSIFNLKTPFQNTIYYEKLNSLWTWHMLEMYYSHGLKTMAFNCQVTDIIFLSCSYGDDPIFRPSVTSDTCFKTKHSQTFFCNATTLYNFQPRCRSNLTLQDEVVSSTKSKFYFKNPQQIYVYQIWKTMLCTGTHY